MAIGEPVGQGTQEELLSFGQLADGNGVEIVDHIERRHFIIETDSRVQPQEISTNEFDFPVDRAITIDTTQINISYPMVAYVRNSLGFVVAELTDDDSQTFPDDEYSIDLSAPVQLYVRFESPCSIDVKSDDLEIDFHGNTAVKFGFRSYHKRPARTIGTTDEPQDMMTAVSYFGSALKTLSCERSFPTLRGHPPLVEPATELNVPEVLEKPATGIEIQIPSDFNYIYSVAPLAYYLAAEVHENDRPRIINDRGFSYSLPASPVSFEQEIERLLKRFFFLDCITRTEGYYQVNLHERNAIESEVDLDFKQLYEEDISTQLSKYLSVPWEVIKEQLPQWKHSAYVVPEAQSFKSLPYLVNDLSIVQTSGVETLQNSSSPSIDVETFLRTPDVSSSGGKRSARESASTPSIVRVGESDSLELTWVGDGAPLGASKAITEAFRNRLNITPKDDDIDITVVCNDTAMSGERDIVNEVYGSRKELPLNVSIHRELTKEQLREVLHQDIDFFHYIGHIDAGGFECADGRLNAACLDHTGVKAFFLNACSSYDQGKHLIKAGSISGVVTLQDVINSGAERVGKTLARLLNQGFPICSALNIAKTESIMGGHYLVIGDGSLDIAQSERLIPISYDIRETFDGYSVKRIVHPNREGGMGSLLYPYFGGDGECHLASGECGSFCLDTKDDLIELFDSEEIPLHFEGSLLWSGELNEHDF